LLVPASLLFGTGAEAGAPDPHAGMAMPVQAAACGGAPVALVRSCVVARRKVPRAGDAVTIERDRNVILDVAPPALRSLTVNGRLSFCGRSRYRADRPSGSTSRGGELEIGSEAQPYTRNATITLTDTSRRRHQHHGRPRHHDVRRHAEPARRPHERLDQARQDGRGRQREDRGPDAAGWRQGDRIVLASTDFDPQQAEERTVTAVRGNALTLDKPLQYMHFGEITYGVDERGEVGLLTRNIRIQASTTRRSSYFGGHIMAMSRVEDVHLGRRAVAHGAEHAPRALSDPLAHRGEGQGQYVENSSIHDTYSRCVTCTAPTTSGSRTT
jgi:cell migration-inducing and hyaluronan-binding protein